MLRDLLTTVKLFLLLAIENCFERPQILVTNHSTKVFSVASIAAAAQRFAIGLSLHRQTRRVRRRTPECGFSITFVLARHRCSDGGTSNRLIVKHSSMPSRRLSAASGCSRSSHCASFSNFAIPGLASSFQAARINDFVCSC